MQQTPSLLCMWLFQDWHGPLATSNTVPQCTCSNYCRSTFTQIKAFLIHNMQPLSHNATPHTWLGIQQCYICKSDVQKRCPESHVCPPSICMEIQSYATMNTFLAYSMYGATSSDHRYYTLLREVRYHGMSKSYTCEVITAYYVIHKCQHLTRVISILVPRHYMYIHL